MINRIPVGLTAEQWDAIVSGLETHPSTINDYRKVLNLLHSYKDGSVRVNLMTREQAAEYYGYLDQRAAEGTLSANTVHRYKATLRSIGARIEEAQSVFPGYVNPFTRLVKNEIRKPTVYTEDMFTDPDTIKRLFEALPELKRTESLIIELMLNTGFSPNQINNLKVSDFHNDRAHPETLELTVPVGILLEKTKNPYTESAYYNNGMPVEIARTSASTVTWNYYGTYTFLDTYTDKLRSFVPDLGQNTDERSFFMTARHMNYSYRAMHHLILVACQNAGLPERALTPNQISMYGMIKSYLLDTALRKHAELDRKLAAAGSEAEKEKIRAEIHETEKVFLPLARRGWIGNWKDRYPIPMQNQINSIKQQLGEEFLLKAVGL